MKNLVYVLLLTLIFNSCSESKDKKVDVVEKKEIKNEFIVNINYKSDKEDSFKILLNNIIVDEFQKKNIHVIEKVFPNTAFETMTANFGENIMSKNILINFGNRNEKVVEIGSINISLGETVLEISSNEIDKYFILNKYISQSDSNVLKTKRIDGKLNPILTSKNKLLNYFKKPIK